MELTGNFLRNFSLGPSPLSQSTKIMNGFLVGLDMSDIPNKCVERRGLLKKAENIAERFWYKSAREVKKANKRMF